MVVHARAIANNSKMTPVFLKDRGVFCSPNVDVPSLGWDDLWCFLMSAKVPIGCKAIPASGKALCQQEHQLSST